MKNILLIGVGGTGSRTVDILFKKKEELERKSGKKSENNIKAIVFDTDAGDIKQIESAVPIPMADNASVGTICDRIGKEYVKEWFPCEDKAIRSQEMFRGASQWRKKSYLAFLNLMNKPKYRSMFISTLEQMTLDPSAPCEVYVISSVAGGTGSGSFIPIALFAKRYLRKNLGKSPIINAMIALPDIYSDSQTPENNTKIYANAYAIFRELNAINLVARGYNKGDQSKKKAPVKLRIGHPDEPNVGILFDSMDKSFWTPEAAPFTQVFVLDKIPNVNSVTAHNIVLANSLFSLICTEIGNKFDSEISNHELLHSQNNGSGAIYAGISTSEVRFPVETILDYVAHKKTEIACEGEWLTLHNAVEARIRENELMEKELGRTYTLGDAGYAKLVLEELKNDAQNNNAKITDMVERGTVVIDEKGNKVKSTNTAKKYFEMLGEEFEARIADAEEAKEAINTLYNGLNAKLVASNVTDFAAGATDEIKKFTEDCVERIKRMKTSMLEAIISFDPKKKGIVNEKLSLINGILMDNKKYLHPVTAMVQLCRFKTMLSDELSTLVENKDFSGLITKREISGVPEALLTLNAEFIVGASESGDKKKKNSTKINTKKSAYIGLGAGRFYEIVSNAEEYAKKKNVAKTDLNTDAYAIKVDANNILDSIREEATSEFKRLVFTSLNAIIDVLIAKYRSFFVRFDKERVNLIEETKDVWRKDCGTIDSIINIYSEKEDKEKILAEILETAGPATEKEIVETNHIVGSGVFENVYASAAATINKKNDFNEKDAGAIKSLFGNMIEAQKNSLLASDAFAAIGGYNVIEAILASCGDDKKKLVDKLRNYFSTACETAKPSIKVSPKCEGENIVEPSSVMVFMMSENTGRYIKRNAELFEIRLPADQSSESRMIEACAEQFIRTYSGDDTARVAVVPSIEDNVLYCTGEIMDISPLKVAKFNELGEDNIYFNHYQKAIYNWKHYETEMWNPHLGNNLHLRGYLPYMNERMEEIYDKKMVKALFYGFMAKSIKFIPRVGIKDQSFIFKTVDGEGRTKAIRTIDGMEISIKNAAQLIKWFRNQDDLIQDWSVKFEEKLTAWKNALPNVGNNSKGQLAELKSRITSCEFMKMLNENLFENPENTKGRKSTGIIEFADLVRTSEEIGRDCDDAEKIISTAYDIFAEICFCHVDPEQNLDGCVDIYRHELGILYTGLLKNESLCHHLDGNGKEDEKATMIEEYLGKFASWFKSLGIFRDFSDVQPIKEDGSLNMTADFEYLGVAKVAETLNKLRAKNVKAEAPAKQASEEMAEVAITEDEEGAEETPAKPRRGRPVGSKKS